MIKRSKEWAKARGLVRENEVHGEEEWRIPTNSNFSFTSTKKREAEGSGSMEVDDPDGTLMNFGDLSAEQTILPLGYCRNSMVRVSHKGLLQAPFPPSP